MHAIVFHRKIHRPVVAAHADHCMDKLKASHILVKNEYEAKDLQKKLAEGKSFEELAKDFSLCPSSRNGGNLGEFQKGQMVAAFEKALLALKPGEVSGVIRTQFGFHLIRRN